MNWKAYGSVGTVLLAAICSSPVFAIAPAVQEAQAQMSQGDLSGALGKLDRYLAASPQDAEARFTRGLVLVKLNRTDDAIKAFADLTRDYPQLPEPYNNLAVLYAQKGDYEKARDALEAALATHPAYATAHENLGDIYAALAGAAYNRALQLDQANQAVRYKLSLIGQLGNGPGAYVAAGTTSVPAGNPKKETLGPAPASVAAAAPAPVAAAAPPPPAAAPSIAPPPMAAATPPPAPAAAAPSEDDAQGLATLTAWTQAWSAKDVGSYFTYYAADFKPDGGVSRAQWEAQRRERITKPGHISVRVINPQVTRADAHHMRINFIQDYRSDSFNDQISKIVELSDSGGAWKITRESVR